VRQVVATPEVEEVVESHRALVVAVAHHRAVVDHVKVDLVVGLFVNQMRAEVHPLPKVSVENKLKVVRLFVNC
jgi:hypothetical protein